MSTPCLDLPPNMLETDEELDGAGAASTHVIFHKNNESDMTNNLWDDTALIKAYDKAVSQAHNQFSELRTTPVGSKKGKKRKGRSKNKSKTWHVGDRCRAIYSDDNQIYNAEVTQMVGNDKCVVLYTDYGNEEQQLLTDLLQSKELPEAHRSRVQSRAASTACSEVSTTGSTSRHSGSVNPAARLHQMGSGFHDTPPTQPFVPPPSRSTGPSFIPPPPPNLADLGVCNDEEALNSMLISWYMSGYHTGYFQGLKQARDEGRNQGS